MAQIEAGKNDGFDWASDSWVVSHWEEPECVPESSADSAEAMAVTAARKKALGASTP
jgi:hypothetical protein